MSYPNELTAAFQRLPWKCCHLDGELVGDVFYAFDLMARDGKDLAPLPFEERFDELAEAFERRLSDSTILRLTPTFKSVKAKTAAMADYYAARSEGVVFRRITAPYRAGRNGQHFKYKFVKTASCIVVSVGKDGKASMELALADLEKCKLVLVGSCSINGKEAPRPGDIVEVKYLYATEAMRLYQPRMLRRRADQVPADCTLAQLQFKEGVA